MKPDVLHLPRDLSKAERAALFAALLLADDETGEVLGGKGALMKVLDVSDAEHFRETVVGLEDDGFLRRGGQPHGTRVWVVLSRFFPGVCFGCRDAIERGKWCPNCRQRLGRRDRAWQPRAIVLAVEGKSPSEIALALNRPLWVNRREDQYGEGDDGGAVVPFLLAEVPFLVRDADAWRRALAEATGEKASELERRSVRNR